MNVKITKEQHEELCKESFKEYLFGSQLHGIATADSDYDYVRVISNDFYKGFDTVAKFLPNIHSFQFDDKENNTQYIWMTERQFYGGLFSGDGNMLSDIVLLSGVCGYSESLFLCRTYKIIKGYLGVAKRDLKLHGNNEKKRFHAFRSLYMAKCLMNNIKPTVNGIQNLKKLEIPTTEILFKNEKELRSRLNSMLNSGELDLYPKFKEDGLVQVMMNSNNVREFKY